MRDMLTAYFKRTLVSVHTGWEKQILFNHIARTASERMGPYLTASIPHVLDGL